MGPDKFNLRALERRVFRSVDSLVDDCYPLRHREPLERLVSAAFAAENGVGLREMRVELVHQNYARLTGSYRDARVVVEALWDFSPRNWGFRLDIVHMRAECEDGEGLVAEILALWGRLPVTGRFRYGKGTFFVALEPASAKLRAAAV